MKKLIILSLLCLAGCQDSNYIHRTFGEQGNLIDEIKVNYDVAMANKDVNDVVVLLADGTIISYGNSKLTTDPNSAKALGKLAESIGKASGQVINKAVKGN